MRPSSSKRGPIRLLASSAAAAALVLLAGPAVAAPARLAGPARPAGLAAADRPAAVAPCPAAPYGARSYAPGSGKTVALTFDDGPGKSTAQILAILRQNHVPATFFNLGQNEVTRPQLVRDEARYGFVLGNHTWDHPDLRRYSSAGQASELDRTSAEQIRLTGIRPCAFRPPYGDYNSVTLSLARGRGLWVWLWSVDPQDWMARGSASAYWVNRIIRITQSQGGALRNPVVLMHNQPNGNPATVKALPVIIAFFRQHGYRFVTL